MATSKLKPPFRADHVGSLLRPPELLAARAKIDGAGLGGDGSVVKPQSLIEVERRSIRDAVAFQERLGLKAITNGDFCNQTWFTDFFESLGNVRTAEDMDPPVFVDAAGNKKPSLKIWVDGKIAWPEGGICVDDFKFLKSITTKVPKVTLPSPLIFHRYGHRNRTDLAAYPTLDEFWADAVKAWRQELAALAEAGCTFIQIDDTSWMALSDPRALKLHEERGEAVADVARLYRDVTQAILRDRPAGLTIGMHICRGNNQGKWTMQGPYEPFAEILFNDLDIDAYFLEYDSQRAGDFAPLRFVPRGKKTIVLGLVTTKSGQLETKDELKRRVDEATKYVPLDQLALSPQCGFASVKQGNPLTMDDQERKLALVVETAAEIWDDA